MITEATGIPDTATTAPAAQQPAAQQPAAPAQEPSQEAVLSELRTAIKEGKEPDLSAIATKTETAKTEPAKAEPGKEPATNGNEQKLKGKHGDSYMPRQDRQKHKAKIEELNKRIAELEAKWKGNPPTAENQIEFTEDNFDYKNLLKERDSNIGEYKDGIRRELAERYSSDDTFKAQHDHYGDMVFRDLDGAGEFMAGIMDMPNSIDVLHGLYDWLDKPGNMAIFLNATPAQRMQVLKIQTNNMRYTPRVPATTPAAPAAPASPPPAAAPASPANPVIPMSVKPDPAGTGGKAGFDLTKQEDCLKYVRQKRKEMM